MQRLDSNTMYIKVNAKWITDQNVRVKAMKLLQENEWGQLHDFAYGSDFLVTTLKAQAMKNWT